MSLVSRFCSGYYATNGVLLFSYFIIRQYFILNGPTQYSRFQSQSELDPLERQILGLLFVAMVIKVKSGVFIVVDVSVVLAVSIIGSVLCDSVSLWEVLAFMMDMRIFGYYVILYLMVFMMFPQPAYQGPDRIERLTPTGLRQCIKQSKSSRITWIVEFYAAWSPTSIHLEPVFAEISLRYGTECLRFAKVDLSRWPGIGKDYNIDLSGASPQVPSFILFENGVESARIPHVYPDGSVAKGKYRKIDLVRGFELDMRYAKTLGKKENKKKD